MANPENRQTKSAGGGEPSGRPLGSPASEPRNPNAGTSGVPRGDGGLTGSGAATARSLYDQAKETAGQAYEAVTDKATTKIDAQRSVLSEGLTTVADSVRQVSDNLGSAKTDSGLAETAAKYTNTAAEKIESVAGYFENKSVRDIARDLEGFARRNPAVFFGAAFGIGLLVARFLKSKPGSYQGGSGRELAAAAGADRQLNPSAPTSEQARNTGFTSNNPRTQI